MMRRLLLALFAAATATSAFTARQPSAQADVTTLNMLSRRNAMLAVVVSLVLPQAANAFSQQLDDHQWEPQQQATDGRLDLNSAFVVSCLTKTGTMRYGQRDASPTGVCTRIMTILTLFLFKNDP